MYIEEAAITLEHPPKERPPPLFTNLTNSCELRNSICRAQSLQCVVHYSLSFHFSFFILLIIRDYKAV